MEDLSQRHSTADFITDSYFYYGRMNIRSVSGEFRWDTTPASVIGPSVKPASTELLQLNPRLMSSDLIAVPRDADAKPYKLSLRRRQSQARDEKLEFFEVSEIDDASKAGVFGTKPESDVVGATIRHFFPAAVMVRFNATRNRARQVAALICGEDNFYSFRAREFSKVEIPASLANEILSVLIGEEPYENNLTLFPETETKITAEALADRFRRFRMNVRANRNDVKQPRTLGELRYEVEMLLVRDQSMAFEVEPEYPMPIVEAIRGSDQFDRGWRKTCGDRRHFGCRPHASGAPEVQSKTYRIRRKFASLLARPERWCATLLCRGSP